MRRWTDVAPGEREAGDRTWETVRRAYDERVPSARRRDWRPLAALAVGAAVVAAAFSPPGQAVWESLRSSDADQLLALPTSGRLLVNTPAGAWVVQRDGSKRFLSGYSDAAWSPRGLYVAAARGNQLVAMEPNGRIHWKIARARPIGGPRWSYEGFRIAYYSGPSLRVVNGDSTGDRLLVRNAVGTGLPALAWRPGTHELAFTDARQHLVLMDVDRGRVIWRRATRGVEQLAWSDDGERLLVAGPRLRVLAADGHAVATLPAHATVPAAFAPRGHTVAAVTLANGESTLRVYSGARYGRNRVVFAGAGAFGGIAWSPNGRWLLVDWRAADQWVFIRTTRAQRIAVRNIGNTFDSGPEHHAVLAGWCCP